jgi:hypothetical protein
MKMSCWPIQKFALLDFEFSKFAEDFLWKTVELFWKNVKTLVHLGKKQIGLLAIYTRWECLSEERSTLFKKWHQICYTVKIV